MTARVFVQPTGRRIAPFNDGVSDVLIRNRPLSSWQEQMIRAAELQRTEKLVPPSLVIPDTLFASGVALARFAEAANGSDAVLVLKDSVFGKHTCSVQPQVTQVSAGFRFDAIRMVSGAGSPPRDVVVDPEEQIVKMPIPTGYSKEKEFEISLPRHPVMTIHHWMHILDANQAAASMGVRQTPGWKNGMRIAWAVLRSLSLNRWKVLSRLNTIGRKCDIHPSAVVEGSALGDRVTVGPLARVLFSCVGDNAVIMPGAQVEASTLGERSVVSQDTVLRLCVLYPEAIAGQQLMQRCVLGRRAVTTLGSYFIDLNFDRDIRVALDGELQSSGTNFLGAAVGHGARVGTGFWMASGRAIPNDCLVVRDPSNVITHISPDLPPGQSLVNDGGRLRPWNGGKEI
jgi:carbonic anhydrase/acetyltransferase-like protein (isoleucine patch superfamily)